MELAAHEITAAEVKVGDVMQYRPVLLSGMGRVVESKVESLEAYNVTASELRVEIVLEDGYAIDVVHAATVVVYRP